MVPLLNAVINYLNSLPRDDDVYAMLHPDTTSESLTVDGKHNPPRLGFNKQLFKVNVVRDRTWIPAVLSVGYDGLLRVWGSADDVAKKPGVVLLEFARIQHLDRNVRMVVLSQINALASADSFGISQDACLSVVVDADSVALAGGAPLANANANRHVTAPVTDEGTAVGPNLSAAALSVPAARAATPRLAQSPRAISPRAISPRAQSPRPSAGVGHAAVSSLPPVITLAAPPAIAGSGRADEAGTTSNPAPNDSVATKSDPHSNAVAETARPGLHIATGFGVRRNAPAAATPTAAGATDGGSTAAAAAAAAQETTPLMRLGLFRPLANLGRVMSPTNAAAAAAAAAPVGAEAGVEEAGKEGMELLFAFHDAETRNAFVDDITPFMQAAATR